MGLAVMVKRALVPTEALDTLEKVDAFEQGNSCTFHSADYCPAVLGTKFEVEVPRQYLDCPLKVELEKGFFAEHKILGYQSRGANDKFYEDGKWENDCVVVDLKTLLSDWERYFYDEDSWDYPLYKETARDHFKRNIIDNFVEGETVVYYGT